MTIIIVRVITHIHRDDYYTNLGVLLQNFYLKVFIMKFLNAIRLKFINGKWFSTQKKSSLSRTVRGRTIFQTLLRRLVISKIYLKSKRFISSNSVACHPFKIADSVQTNQVWTFQIGRWFSFWNPMLVHSHSLEPSSRRRMFKKKPLAFITQFPPTRFVRIHYRDTIPDDRRDTTNDSDDACCEMGGHEKSAVRREGFW